MSADRMIERAVLDQAFQAACQRYAHGNGSSHAIAAAALRAAGMSELLKELKQLAHGTLLDEVNHDDDSLRTIAYRSACEYSRLALLAHATRIDATLAQAAEEQP